MKIVEVDQQDVIAKALDFATKAHSSVDQIRKYTGDAYIVHPIEVAEIVKGAGGSIAMQAAALLHDTVEDTDVTSSDIATEFGSEIAKLVSELTDVSKPEDGNRALRKGMDRAHSASASRNAQVIKLADLISNTKSIKQHDPNFWKVYRKEKIALLAAMDKVHDHPLYNVAKEQVQ